MTAATVRCHCPPPPEALPSSLTLNDWQILSMAYMFAQYLCKSSLPPIRCGWK